MKKVLIVFGTRPEAIKMAPLVKEFLKHPDTFDVKLCVTAQHREMLDQVLEFFELMPDFDLDLMKPNQNLYTLTADIITGMKPILDDVNPDFVFVHGDTTTSTSVALAGFYHGTKVCHVEAGLRTFNKHSPWPEEMNRQLTGRIADYHFAPTETAKKNLLEEKVDPKSILVTGNTVIDALMFAVEKVRANPPQIPELAHLLGTKNQELSTHDDPEIVLITGHRRENHGQGFENICKAIAELASKFPETHFIYPVHLNPNVREPVNRLLGRSVVEGQTSEDGDQLLGSVVPSASQSDQAPSPELSTKNQVPSTPYPNIHLIEPLDYPSFVWLMDKAKLIITDSGGVQEEAPSLGKPVLVMRDTTERPEAVDAGTVVLVGTDTEKIIAEAMSLLMDETRYQNMAHLHNPYGDGHACNRIVKFVAGL